MCYKQLTEIERYQMKTMLKANFSKSRIAKELKRHPSTIGREIKRNSGLRGYRPQQAHKLALDRRQNHSHTLINPRSWQMIESLLRQEWSPEQISGRLLKENGHTVSTEWIYQYVLNDKHRNGDLYKFLRCQKKRRKRYGCPDYRGRIKNRVGIEHRPAIVETRSRIGDWEVDTVIGRRSAGPVLVTLAERKSRLSVLALSKNKTAIHVKQSLVEAMQPLSKHVHTLTYDNGKEFAMHQEIADKLQATGYFANPYHSWERGLNENMNGLIRQYAPKGSNFDLLCDSKIQYIMDRLNNRPRKCLGFKTPNEVFYNINQVFALAS